MEAQTESSPTAYADTMFPSSICPLTNDQFLLSRSVSGIRFSFGVCRTRYRRLSSDLSSGEMTSFASTVVMPNAASVGGTIRSSKVPLIESFPPMDVKPSSTCIFNAPSSALNGSPQVWRSGVILWKYSWYENLILSYCPPAETTLAQASTTAYAAA